MVKYDNVGTQPTCDVRVEVEIPNTLDEYALLHTFNSIKLKDEDGNPVVLQDKNGNDLSTDPGVTLTKHNPTPGSYVFRL